MVDWPVSCTHLNTLRIYVKPFCNNKYTDNVNWTQEGCLDGTEKI